MNEHLLEEMMPAFEGVIPAVVSTASVDGTPNVTYVSQVFYVDDMHVALSRQFFNKTVKNITENPMVCVVLTSPVTYALYKLQLRFKESQAEGIIYEQMKLQLDVIAGVQGMADVFHLLAADLFEIVEIIRLYPL
jgi:predicted pyridoxine 5'-phosphate oxidase superfamily flavin-nucleotide-binding protein